MSNKNFDEGVNQREETPWSPASSIFNEAPNEAYRVSGGGVRGLLPPDSGTRNQPIRGHADLAPIPGCHGSQVINGTGVMTSPTNRQVQGLVLERMAQNVSTQQYDHSHTIAVPRGMPGKQDFPDGTGRATGRIKASLQFGLGPNVAIPADLGHDPLDTPIDHDYRRQPEGPVPGSLDKYVGAAGVLAQPVGNASGFTRIHERSQFATMGDDILGALGVGNVAPTTVPRASNKAPVPNTQLGQSR